MDEEVLSGQETDNAGREVNMPYFCKKPIIIEAEILTGRDNRRNA